MISIIYASKQTEFSFERMDQILAVSRRNNALNHVSGTLVYNQSEILQNIEGEPEAIRWTFERICRDDRHEGVRILSLEVLERRRFPSWDMKAALLEGETLRAFRLVPSVELAAFQPRRLSASAAEDFIVRLSELYHGAPAPHSERFADMKYNIRSVENALAAIDAHCAMYRATEAPQLSPMQHARSRLEH